MVYILLGYWPNETHEDREFRRQRLRDFGARPYPMPYVRTPELVGYQRWIIGASTKTIPWDEWKAADTNRGTFSATRQPEPSTSTQARNEVHQHLGDAVSGYVLDTADSRAAALAVEGLRRDRSIAFARNSRFGTLTNDLNPETEATHHLDALEFLSGLVAESVQADAVLFDPPYSPRQVMECYQGIGRTMTQADGQGTWYAEKSAIDRLLQPGGIVICCGWNSQGMGGINKFALDELLLVAHGSSHNDTIVTVERKMQAAFDFNAGAK